MATLYKRNAQGKPIFWNIEKDVLNGIKVTYGLVGRSGHVEHITTARKESDEIKSLIAAKRKEGYKELQDLYDNAPASLTGNELEVYLDCYLPNHNTHSDGKFIPMLCKTLQDNKPFEKSSYFGQWKINGERCIITADKSNDLFQTVKLYYRSREGVDWTDKLSYLDEILIPKINTLILDMMIDEGVGLDGELYIPGYGINEINSFIKNPDMPQHYQLQYWLYDICMENATAYSRNKLLTKNFAMYLPLIKSKEDHINNQERLVLLPSSNVTDITEATIKRDYYISLGFEGLVVRANDAEYQFGGKRNNSMLKYKKKLDGYFNIVAIKEDKRGLPIFTLKNDLNDELFDATINLPQDKQRIYLDIKDSVIAHGKALVEYRERSGIKEVPFHAKIITINL